jgi:hypothetical protein
MDQITKHVPSAHLMRIGRFRIKVLQHRPDEGERAMRSLAAGVLPVGAKHTVEVVTAEDQGPIQALGSDRADPVLGVGVRVGRPDRGEDHLRAFPAEHLVEGTGELRVPVVDQEAKARRALLKVD